jgi:cell division septal protein FtsQ
MPVTAPSDRRLLRARVKPGRRQGAWRSRLRLLRGALALAGIAFAGYLVSARLADAPGLRVSRIVVRGNERLSTDEVMSLVEGLRGQSVLRADLDRWRLRLLRSPWVAEAAIHRYLPGTIEIQILERRPIGVGRLKGELYLVDEVGTVIDEYGPRYADLDLPIIDGLQLGAATGAAGLDRERAGLAARLLRALQRRPELARRVSQIDVTDSRDAVVILDKDTTLVHLGHEQFVERLQAYVELAPSLREQVPSIDYVDLRFGEHVFVGPVARAGKPADAAAGDRRKAAPPGF